MSSILTSTTPTSNLVVQLSDPPLVPPNSQAFYVDYNKVDVLVSINGNDQWYNISQSGVVNLLSLINKSSVVALGNLPNDSQVKLVGINVTGAKIEINRTNQTVLIGESFIESNVTGNSSSSLKNIVIDFSPVVSVLITADRNVFILTPTVKAIIAPPTAFENLSISKVPPKIGEIAKFAANFSRELVKLFSPNAMITSASMKVNGNITSFNVTVKDISNKSLVLHALMIAGNKTIYMPPLPNINIPNPIPQVPHAVFSMTPDMVIILPNGTQLKDKMINLTDANFTLVSGQNISVSLNKTGNYSFEQVYKMNNAFINNITFNKSTGVAKFENIRLPDGTELVISLRNYISTTTYIPGLVHMAEGLAKEAPLFYLINSTGGISFPEFRIPILRGQSGTLPVNKPSIKIYPQIERITSPTPNFGISMGNITGILTNISGSVNGTVISIINRTLSKLNITNITNKLIEEMNVTDIAKSINHDINDTFNISGISMLPNPELEGYILSPGQSVTISYTGKLYLEPNIPVINNVNYGRPFAVPIVGNNYVFTVLTQGGPVSYNVTAI